MMGIGRSAKRKSVRIYPEELMVSAVTICKATAHQYTYIDRAIEKTNVAERLAGEALCGR